jgi:hypothetical protein
MSLARSDSLPRFEDSPFMKRIVDIVIVVGVIVGAVSIGAGLRVIGAVSLLIAMIVGWKRDWAIDLFEEMMDSSEGSAVNETREMQDSDLHDCSTHDVSGFGDSGGSGESD